MLIYIFLCIGIGLGGTAFLYQSGRAVSAIVFLLGSVMVFFFFGLRWFSAEQNPYTSKLWPPVINTCPDYLVYYARPTADGSTAPTCVDPLGISRKPAELMKWSGAPTTDNEAYYFSLTFTEAPGLALRNAQCERAMAKGVSWEGITDGETCYKYKTPTSPGTAVENPDCPPGTMPNPTAPPTA